MGLETGLEARQQPGSIQETGSEVRTGDRLQCASKWSFRERSYL